MVLRFRGQNLNRRHFFGGDEGVLSSAKSHGTWHNFKNDDRWTYWSLIGSLTVPPFFLFFGPKIRKWLNWEDETIHYLDPSLTIDYPMEERHKMDDEGIEYEIVYADGTRETRH